MDQREMRAEFAAFAELAARHVVAPAGPATGNLTRFEYNVYSQNGEDGIVAEIFRRIGPGGRRFIEIGAEPWQSNAIALADLLGWGGTFVEAMPERVAAFRDKYAGFRHVDAIEAMVTPAWVREFDATGPADLDLLSIDVDGNDFWIWAAFERMRPKVVLIEYNSHPGPHRAVVQPESGVYVDWHWDFFGASATALMALASRKGYTLVHTESHGVNAFFVRDDLIWAFTDLDLGALPLRGPSFDGRGRRHGADATGRSYLEIDSAEVAAALARTPSRLAAPGMRAIVADGADATEPGAGWRLDVGEDGLPGFWIPDDEAEISSRDAGMASTLAALIRPGMNVLEIGAGFGKWTMRAAALAGPDGRVLAVAPNPSLATVLEANLALSGERNVEMLPIAATGMREAGTTESAVVPVDAMVSPGERVQVVLVDAGGREAPVISAMAGFLARHEPTVLVAFDPATMGNGDAMAALAGFRSAGFDVSLAAEDAVRLLATGEEFAGMWLLSPAIPAEFDLALAGLAREAGAVTLMLRPLPGGFRPQSR